MKFIASLLTMLALVGGAVTASTAYAPLVTSIDAADRLILSAPAGIQESDDPEAPPASLVSPETELTTEVIETLTVAEVKRVRVKEFAWSRWNERWYFVLSLLGFVVAAALTRATRTEAPVDAHAEGSPQSALRSLLNDLEELDRELATLSGEDQKLDRIVADVEQLQRGRIQDFVDGREQLIRALGMGGFAQLMDRFAAAERQINRAWSAAADRYIGEATHCLAVAQVRLAEAIEKLGTTS